MRVRALCDSSHQQWTWVRVRVRVRALCDSSHQHWTWVRVRVRVRVRLGHCATVVINSGRGWVCGRVYVFLSR